MRDEKLFNSTSRMLRFATAGEVVFLVISGFFLFTEHRAHYLGALPYALLIVAVTVFLWLLSERRRHRPKPEGIGDERQQPGERSQLP
jgi:hypothetical protein